MPYSVHVADETGQIIKTVKIDTPTERDVRRVQAFNDDDTLDVADVVILYAAPDSCPFDCESCHAHVAPEDLE